MSRPAALLCLLAAVAGCGRVNPRPAFDDAAEIVRQRTGAQARWARSAAETEELERQVSQLLSQPLTVDAAVRIALLNNRSLQASFEEVAIAQADAAQAGVPSNPEFGLSLRFPDRPPSASNLEIGVAQNLLDFLILPRRKKIALAELEQTKLRVAAGALDLAAEVKAAFYSLQASLRLTQRLKLIQEVNEAAAEFAHQQNQAGTLNDLDLASHLAAYSQSKVEVALAEVQIRAGREKLNRLLGLWGHSVNPEISQEPPPLPEQEIPLQGLESLALRQRPELQVARLGVDVLGQALALKKGTRFFPVGVHVGVDTERETERQFVTGPTLALQLPIFDFGRASIARLEAQQLQAQRRLEAMAVEARSEVRELRDLVLASRELAQFYEKTVLPQRREILDLTLIHYNSMLKGAYDLLLAKEEQIRAERAYIEAWRDYWVARARLERALGGRLPDQAAAAEPHARPDPGAQTPDKEPLP